VSRLALVILLALVCVIAARGIAGTGERGAASSGSAPAARDAVRLRVAPEPPGARAARLALEAVGAPYRWGGASRAGFDCSGLVMWAFGRIGVRLPHNAWSQSRLGRPVRRARLRPGDLLFFHEFGHVGIYIGRGRMVHAPQSGERVEVIRLADGRHGRRFELARRLPLA
jgi:cell wall-associated NlpC family hydrolase